MGLENRHNCSQPDDIKSSDHRRDMPNSDKTDNAGLELTADMLEEILCEIARYQSTLFRI